MVLNVRFVNMLMNAMMLFVGHQAVPVEGFVSTSSISVGIPRSSSKLMFPSPPAQGDSNGSNDDEEEDKDRFSKFEVVIEDSFSESQAKVLREMFNQVGANFDNQGAKLNTLQGEVNTLQGEVNGIRSAFTPAVLMSLLETAVIDALDSLTGTADSSNVPFQAGQFGADLLTHLLDSTEDGAVTTAFVKKTARTEEMAAAIMFAVAAFIHCAGTYQEFANWPLDRNPVSHNGRFLDCLFGTPNADDVPFTKDDISALRRKMPAKCREYEVSRGYTIGEGADAITMAFTAVEKAGGNISLQRNMNDVEETVREVFVCV